MTPPPDTTPDPRALAMFILRHGTLEQAKAQGLVRTDDDETLFRALDHDIRSIVAQGGVVDLGGDD